MIIYEVELSIEASIYPAFHLWVIEHVQEVIGFKGFKVARVLEPIEIDNPEVEAQFQHLILQYELERYEDLLDFFELHSQRLRKEAAHRFGNQFKVERRVYKENCNFVASHGPVDVVAKEAAITA